MATWGSPFVDGPLSDLGPTASTKVYPCALIPDFTTRRPLGDSRSVQLEIFQALILVIAANLRQTGSTSARSKAAGELTAARRAGFLGVDLAAT
jgi:hypothetical protein